ncbi:hypothetical protein [Actinoplanes awajinensis]|uniref:Uncharacterized protein n=1 Tax=Actinoplanes awajinensis subsp. mycoplanecinus TaxID=135947 RepID=A0A101JLA0_9ACTN|nr:hypothetical protein [Actinoplanes awajinensis]KUL28834.1 hypothetical protein ADL15_30505 [Actinoplanes awajinensis subsp. mycoplanecinus]
MINSNRDRRRIRSGPAWTLVLVLLGPLLLALAGLVHPGGLSAATAHRWVWLHIALLPVFPLLGLGFLVLLREQPRAGLPRVTRVLAWIGVAVYAVGYTGLDAVAGIAAGTVAGQDGDPAELRRLVLALYRTANGLGTVGVSAFLVATLAAAITLSSGYGLRVLPGTLVLLAAGWSFLDSHIFSPRGVLTMLAMAAGFASWMWATAERRNPPSATSTAGPAGH